MAIKEFDMSKVEVVCPSNEVELEGVIKEMGGLVDRVWVVILEEVVKLVMFGIGGYGGEYGDGLVIVISGCVFLELLGEEFDALFEAAMSGLCYDAGIDNVSSIYVMWIVEVGAMRKR